MDTFIFFHKKLLLPTVTFTVILGLCLISIEGKSQSIDKPDLRDDSCVNCKGQANNFSILNAYFSDENGVSNENLCEGGPYFISVLYTSTQNNSVNNFRIIADILKRDQTTDAILESFYMNEFEGTVPPCNSATCVITLPIPNLNFQCDGEYYELSNPMSFWTQAGNKNLEDSYKCNDYPTAQCSHSASIPIEVGTLEYNFDVNFECFQENLNHTNVSFFITSLFGGNPTEEYEVNWNFDFKDGTIINSSDINPSFQNVESGELVTVTLTISQDTLNGVSIEKSYVIPIALNEEEVIESSTVLDSEDDQNNGSIEVQFKPGNYFYYWTSLDDPDFYSEESKIEDLPVGTYRLTTFDEETGLCRTDIFEITLSILPVELKYFKAEYLPIQKTTQLTWATTKEWESSHFEILRSYENVDNWKTIAELDAAGYSEKVQYYEFTDREILTKSRIIYYQLRQVDFDGTYEMSKVIGVQLPKNSDIQNTWKIYPNPVENQAIKLILTETENYVGESLTAILINPLGGTFNLKVQTIESLTEQINTILSQNSKGVYVLQIAWDKETQQIKILKR